MLVRLPQRCVGRRIRQSLVPFGLVDVGVDSLRICSTFASVSPGRASVTLYKLYSADASQAYDLIFGSS